MIPNGLNKLGGAPVSPIVFNFMRKCFHQCEIVDTYGAMECEAIYSNHMIDPSIVMPGITYLLWKLQLFVWKTGKSSHQKISRFHAAKLWSKRIQWLLVILETSKSQMRAL